MKVSDLLLERHFSDVLVKGPLTIIPSLIQKEFGLHFKDLRGACLASQFIFTLSDIAKISPQDLVDAVNIAGDFKGVTFEKLFAKLNKKPIKLKNGKTITFDLSLETFDVDEAIAQVQQGQPVVTVVSANLAGRIDALGFRKDGILKSAEGTSLNKAGGYYHALLMVGYDSKEKTVIFREMRNNYGFKGFAKIPLKEIKKHPENFKFISTVVDDFTVTDTKEKKK